MAAEYYSTAFHEAVHSTGHASRLNRLEATAHFGNEEYSKEELVAEIGAAALVSLAGLESRSSFKNSAAYIQHWLKATDLAHPAVPFHPHFGLRSKGFSHTPSTRTHWVLLCR